MRFFLFLVPVLASGLFLFGLFGACSSGGGGEDAGAPCGTDKDCPASSSSSTVVRCMWPTTRACGQLGACVPQPEPASVTCVGPHVCPCDGGEALTTTCYGSSLPVTGDQGCLGAPCTTSDDCNAGLSCQDSSCSSGVASEEGGTDAGPDADSGPASDAGPDSGAGLDAASTVDSSSPADAGPDDAG
jgi:hypothetical protein